MDKKTINENLNQVMLEKRYSGNLRELEGGMKKFLMYGPVALLLGAGVAYLWGALMVYIYRHVTDKCRKSCGSDAQCYNKCYYINCKKVVEIIKSDLKKINTITDPKKRESIKKKLTKELKVWTDRMNKYKERLNDTKL